MKRLGVATMATWVGVLALFLSLTTPGVAAEEKVKAKVGEMAPDFELPQVGDGQKVKLSDFRGEKIVVVTFQSMTCPWDSLNPDSGYQIILNPLSQRFKSQDVEFIAINSNRTETSEKLATHAEARGIPYPILKDEGNKVADLYGAKTTPHFFVVDKEGKLRYMGGFEEVPGNPEQCGKMDEQYLVPVLEAVINGSEVPYTQTTSKGCGIKRVS